MNVFESEKNYQVLTTISILSMYSNKIVYSLFAVDSKMQIYNDENKTRVFISVYENVHGEKVPIV